MSIWMCIKRAAGSVKSPTGVTVWREILERLQAWQARAQVRQSFCTPGHTKHCATSFAVDFVPVCNKSWADGLPICQTVTKRDKIKFACANNFPATASEVGSF
jgi:hypothetical protein